MRVVGPGKLRGRFLPTRLPACQLHRSASCPSRPPGGQRRDRESDRGRAEFDNVNLMRIGAIAIVWAGLCGAVMSAHDPIGTKVTWVGDIARIFQARCVHCHRASGNSPMPLTSYEEARPWASAIRQQVLSRKMPIWHAARGFGDFANDPSLSPFQIALIAAWANAGAPRGSDSEAPSVPDAIVPSRDVRPAPLNTIERSLTCGSQALSGRLLAVEPHLDTGGSMTITAVSRDRQHTVVAWIRDYDSRHEITYWLRSPLTLTRGSRLEVAATGKCRLTVTLAR